MSWWKVVALLALPLAILFAVHVGGGMFEDIPTGRLTKAEPTATAELPPYKAARDLQALEVADAGAICDTGDGKGTPAPWSNRVVLVDVAAGKPVDPSSALGPKLDPTAVLDMQFVTVSLRRPAWALSPGDVVTLIAVPPGRPGTPTPVTEQERFPRIEGVTIINVPWSAEGKPGDEGLALIALTGENEAFFDVLAAGGVAVPIGAVSTQGPPPAPGATMAPTIATCPTAPATKDD